MENLTDGLGVWARSLRPVFSRRVRICNKYYDQSLIGEQGIQSQSYITQYKIFKRQVIL